MTVTTRGPAFYQPIPFHTLRISSGISCVIVTGILVYFCYQLKTDGFKLPWTFLITLLACVLNILVLLLTLLTTCCGRFSPLFNVLVNIPMLLLWIVAFSILTYNIYGLLARSCSLTNWAISDGVSVCTTYKILFTFAMFATLSQLALTVMDVKARREQVKAGKYDKMGSNSDIKLQPTAPVQGSPGPAVLSSTLNQGDMYGHDVMDDGHGHGQVWRPGMSSSTSPYDKKGDVVVHEYALEPQSQHQYQEQHSQNHYQQQQQQHYVSSEYHDGAHEHFQQQQQQQQYPQGRDRMGYQEEYEYHNDQRAPMYQSNTYGYRGDGRF